MVSCACSQRKHAPHGCQQGATMSLTLPWTAPRPLSTDQTDFLDDVFAPVPSETETTALRVVGELPAALNGVYARIGPNPLKPNPKRYHWFIGDGMVHGLRLKEGRAEWYRSRYVGSNTAHKALGRPLLPGPRHGVGDVVLQAPAVVLGLPVCVERSPPRSGRAAAQGRPGE